MKLKKYLLILAILCLALLCAMSTTACNSTRPDPTEPSESTPSEDNTPTPDEPCKHETYEWIIDTAPTCTVEGSKHKECLSCKENIESAKISTTDHTEKIVTGKSATCSETGLTDGKVCSVCNKVLLEQNEIPLKAHTEEINESVKATCTTTGLTAGKYCSVCNAIIVEQQITSALNHIESDWIIDTVAGIGVEGAKHTECTRCNVRINSGTIPALEENHVHQGKEWITTKPATCTEEGTKNLICECGEVMDFSTIGKLTHTEEIVLGKAPTCTATGLTDGKKCAVCDEPLLEQTVIAKTSHTEETIIGKDATCTVAGTTDGVKCSVCTVTLTAQMPIPPKGHSFTDGSCTACGISEPYGIWIVDGQGNPMNDIIVKIMKNGEQIKMFPYKGEFLSFELDSDTYEIALDLSQLSQEYVYDASSCVLSPGKRSTTIRLFKTVSKETTSLFIGSPVSTDYNAYYISDGAYSVDLTPNDYTFFIFSPKNSAVYSVTYECDADLQISYHGSSFFAQGVDLSTTSSDISKYENGISINVYASNLGSNYVIAVKSTSATSCILNIKNAGDPGTRLEDEPWTPYLEDEKIVEKQLNVKPSGEYKTIDVTDMSLSAVFNENDGYYHLGSADGPIIFIDLISDSKFVSSIQTICAHQRMGVYVYDVNGKVVEKRSYNELFIQYGMSGSADSPVTAPIRVPLTKKLAEAIQNFGNKNSWWAPDSEMNIFTKVLLGQPYNQDIAWLLFCGYYS